MSILVSTVIEGDPVLREQELLEEQDRLEYEGGLIVCPQLVKRAEIVKTQIIHINSSPGFGD